MAAIAAGVHAGSGSDFALIPQGKPVGCPHLLAQATGVRYSVRYEDDECD